MFVHLLLRSTDVQAPKQPETKSRYISLLVSYMQVPVPFAIA